MVVVFVGLMVVPIQTAEELETGTFGALRLAASGPEILLGLLVRNAGALNAYGGLLVVPVLGAAAAVFAADSGIIWTMLDLLPFSKSVRLLADGVSSRPVFDTGPLSWLVIVAWALAGHAVLARVASRREL